MKVGFPVNLMHLIAYLILSLSSKSQKFFVLSWNKIYSCIFQKCWKHKKEAYCHPNVNSFDVWYLTKRERESILTCIVTFIENKTEWLTICGKLMVEREANPVKKHLFATFPSWLFRFQARFCPTVQNPMAPELT